MNQAKSYKDVLKYRSHRKVKRFARNRALDILGPLQRIDKKPTLSFLSFHYLFEGEHDNFRKMLAYLCKYYTPVSYSEAIHHLNNGDINENMFCISSDDGFENYLEAARIMNEFEVSACVFICPSIIGEKDENTVKKFNNERLLGPTIPFLNWSQVDQVLELGHEVGNHTNSHYDLGSLSTDQLHAEISEAHDTIVKQTGKSEHFAWPYGKPNRIQDSAFPLLDKLEYKSAASTIRGHYYQDKRESGPYIKRNNFEPFWPVNHLKYFLHSARYR